MGQIQGTSLYVTDNCKQSSHILPEDSFVCASLFYQLVEQLCLFLMCLVYVFFFSLPFPYKVQTGVTVYLNYQNRYLAKIYWWTIILTFTLIEPFYWIVVFFVLR